MATNLARDGLALLGVATAAYLVLAGVGTVVGQPWQYGAGGVVTAAKVVGALATIAIGVALAWLVTRG